MISICYMHPSKEHSNYVINLEGKLMPSRFKHIHVTGIRLSTEAEGSYTVNNCLSFVLGAEIKRKK